jgi:hypothetical protein
MAYIKRTIKIFVFLGISLFIHMIVNYLYIFLYEDEVSLKIKLFKKNLPIIIILEKKLPIDKILDFDHRIYIIGYSRLKTKFATQDAIKYYNTELLRCGWPKLEYEGDTFGYKKYRSVKKVEDGFYSIAITFDGNGVHTVDNETIYRIVAVKQK